MPSIHFLDVTNRDGVQTARTGLSKFGKISTSDQMITHKFRGRLDRSAIIAEMTAAVAAAQAGGAETVGVNAEDGSRTDEGYLTEFALAAREAGATRVRYCDTIGGDSPGRIRERFAKPGRGSAATRSRTSPGSTPTER